MKSAFRILLLLCCLTVLPLSVSAQNDTQTVDLGDSYSIAVPDDWQVTENENGYFTLEGDTITVEVMTPRYIRSLGINFNQDRNVSDVLIALTTLFDGVEPDRDEIEKLLYGDTTAAGFTIADDEATDQFNVALVLLDGLFGYITVTVENDQLDVFSDRIDPIISSFQTTHTEAASGDPCTVRADDAATAQLRVGPGTNRGAISFLPEDTDVTATGRIELEDGSIWYQLEIDEAAPDGTAAAELWVFDEDVTLSGDCENVGDTDAPPVIRAAPQVVTQPQGDGSAPVETNATITPGLLQATPGSWTLTINPVLNASCGGENAPLSSSEIYGELTYVYSVSILSPDLMVFFGDLYRRYPGSNSFDGMFTYADGVQSPARLDVLSPTTIHGEINDLFQYDGYTCSATTLFDSTHN
jgi:hypothetical protein